MLLIGTLLWCCAVAFAQSGDEARGRMPYYGYVVTADSLRPIRNTHVISKMAHCGTITNRRGEFVISAKSVDTLWVSCLGYSRRLIPIDSTLAYGKDTLLIRLKSDTITLREVAVFPFYNYEIFKEMLIAMPSIEMPREIQKTYEDLEDVWLSRPMGSSNGMPTITVHPIQYLYDKYNKSARRQATLLRNRRTYNEVLREQGRLDELLPDSLDYTIDYKVYELDEAEEKKTMMYRWRTYNEMLREQGRLDELLPDSLDYPLYKLDESADVGKPKALVPKKKKYIHLGE